MRPIDADALIENHFSDEHRIALSYADKLWMRRIISDEPTIDAVPVVRCKDCVYWGSPEGNEAKYCMKTNGLKGILSAEDYCSLGERKERTP